MAKQKKTKKAAKKLDRMESFNAGQAMDERDAEIKREARIDTLNGLRDMVVNGIQITVVSLDELIEEVQKATTPVAKIEAVN